MYNLLENENSNLKALNYTNVKFIAFHSVFLQIMLPSSDAAEWNNYIVIITNPFNDLPPCFDLQISYYQWLNFIQQKTSVNLPPSPVTKIYLNYQNLSKLFYSSL